MNKLPKPTLSVLMPAYNAEKYVAEAIESILNQTYTDFEIIIADDGSTDGTKAIIDSYDDPRILTSHNETNCGKVDTTNRIYQLSKGSYITIHDADDYSYPGKFEKQIDFLESHPEYVMCGVSFNYIKPNGKILKSIIKSDSGKDIESNSHFLGPTILFKKKALGSKEIYRSFFENVSEDTDLVYRIAEKGKCTNFSDILYSYRMTPSSLSRGSIMPKYKRLIKGKMAAYFAQQRLERGKDDLQLYAKDEVEKKVLDLTQPYLKDHSLVFREMVASTMYFQWYRSAIGYALKAVKIRPFLFINWRTLQYCIRKTIFKKIRNYSARTKEFIIA